MVNAFHIHCCSVHLGLRLFFKNAHAKGHPSQASQFCFCASATFLLPGMVHNARRRRQKQNYFTMLSDSNGPASSISLGTTLHMSESYQGYWQHDIQYQCHIPTQMATSLLQRNCLKGSHLRLQVSINVTEKSFDHQHLRGLQTVLKRTIGGSSHVSVQATHRSTKHPEASMSGQAPPAQVQNGQASSVFQASGKHFCSQREGSDDGEDKDTSRRKRSRIEKSPSSAKKLACPFHRHDPESHRKHRSCAGPGWASIHRVE